MNKYAAAPGAKYGVEQAKRLGIVLEKIGFTATPKQIVQVAKPKSSPIHGMFEWVDSVAAEKYRLWQARDHVNHLQVVIVGDRGDRRAKAFHSVIVQSGDDSERGYTHMANVRENKDFAEQVVANALRELTAWKHRYSEYRELFSPVLEAIEQTEKKLARTKQRRQLAKAS